MANKERLLELAAIVEKGHHKFNGVHAALLMGNWSSKMDGVIYATEYDSQEQLAAARPDLAPSVKECNTVACIAGFTCFLFDYKNASNPDQFGDYKVPTRAKELLELTYNQAKHLFLGNTNDEVTGPQAAQVIRHFAETDEIRWDLFTKFPRRKEDIDDTLTIDD